MEAYEKFYHRRLEMSAIERREEIYRRALERFGEDQQLIAIAEELCELAAVVLRVVNGKLKNVDLLLLEMADAEIVLEQLQRFYKEYLPRIEFIKESQLIRLEEKLNELDNRDQQ